MTDFSGSTISHYHVIEKLGQGGMATVYRAYDTRLERDVAIKLVRKEAIPPEQLERILKRFEREAKSLAKFLHPNIVPVHDFGEHNGAPYLVMAYLPGGTLKVHTGKPMPLPEALHYVIPIADALGYAHKRGVIHRDVKPSNILITEDGVVMLSDFGIARVLEESATQLTATGLGVGTPEYMAPEQWVGQANEASDQYALGVVLYELLTGKKPYTADTPMAVAFKAMQEPLPRPRQIIPTIPEAAEKVLFKALARQAADRYADMEDMGKAMRGLVAAGTPAAPSSQKQEIAPQTQTAKVRALPADDGETRDAWEESQTVMKSVKLDQREVDASTPARPPVSVQKPAIAAKRPENANEPWVIELPGGMPMAFVRVPAGRFLMGNNAGDKDEQPEHEVYLDEYFIGKYPVTNEQYACYLRESGKNHRKLKQIGQLEKKGKANHPVVEVSWHDAVKFCEWLSGISGQAISLPTEAQWEKAARGVDGRMYPWGNEKPTSELCNFGGKEGGTTAAGRYARGASPYGALDMAGNVWEWVADWYDEDYYSSSADENPQGPASGNYRVLRGGSWFNIEGSVRASYRLWFSPSDVGGYLGFRCFVSP